MLIVSKFKDYYDFLSGVWGIDPKLVLDRREFDNVEFYSYDPQHITLYICGKSIDGFWDGENFYYGEDLSKFGDIHKRRYWGFRRETEPSRVVEFEFKGNGITSVKKRYEIMVDIVNSTKPYNLKENCPILMKSPYGKDKFYKFPVLSKMNVGSILPPEVIYQMLVDWYSERNNEAEKRPDNQTDLQKLESRGFDKKESFRNI